MKIATGWSIVLCVIFTLGGCDYFNGFMRPVAISPSDPLGITYNTSGKDIWENGDNYGFVCTRLARSRTRPPKFVASLILVCPSDQLSKYHLCTAMDESGGRCLAYYFSENIDEPVICEHNQVCFVDNGNIVFCKTNEELGIDTADHQKAFSEENLKPILEKMIRENKLNVTEE